MCLSDDDATEDLFEVIERAELFVLLRTLLLFLLFEGERGEILLLVFPIPTDEPVQKHCW